MSLEIVHCRDVENYKKAKEIAMNYIEWLGLDLSFQKVDREFDSFETMYGSPSGCYLLALDHEQVCGGVGLRALEGKICEMKRLFVKSEFRGRSIGEELCKFLLTEAKALGYQKMRLDTIHRLNSANRLYETLGFKDIKPYYENPIEGARFMEIDLKD